MSRQLDFIKNNFASRSAFEPYGFRRGPVTPTSLNNYIAPVQFQRLATDIGGWREAIREAENPMYPMRVRLIRMYLDTVINPYIRSVFEKWEELTLQRDYQIYQIKGGKKNISEDLSQRIQDTPWFKDYIKYTLHADAYGYSLINLGDIIDDGFPEITFTPRENIRPDGINNDGKPVLTSLTYAIDGIRINDHPLIELCNHFVSTPSNTGFSKCGIGLLYETAFCEIHLRHIMEWNMDYMEMYGMPIKKGSTKKVGDAREDFLNFLANGASNQYVLLDDSTNDKVEYEWAQSVGTAWKSYNNIEDRLEGKVAQLWLGHTDAMKSTPGKLGGQQAANKDGFNESLIEQAMNAKRIRYGDNVTKNINSIFAPKMRKLGRYVGNKYISDLIPQGYYFGLQNDSEETQIRRRINAERSIAAKWVRDLYESGLRPDVEQLEDFMKLKLTEHVPVKELDEKRTNTSTIIKEEE